MVIKTQDKRYSLTHFQIFANHCISICVVDRFFFLLDNLEYTHFANFFESIVDSWFQVFKYLLLAIQILRFLRQSLLILSKHLDPLWIFDMWMTVCIDLYFSSFTSICLWTPSESRHSSSSNLSQCSRCYNNGWQHKKFNLKSYQWWYKLQF